MLLFIWNLYSEKLLLVSDTYKEMNNFLAFDNSEKVAYTFPSSIQIAATGHLGNSMLVGKDRTSVVVITKSGLAAKSIPEKFREYFSIKINDLGDVALSTTDGKKSQIYVSRFSEKAFRLVVDEIDDFLAVDTFTDSSIVFQHIIGRRSLFFRFDVSTGAKEILFDRPGYQFCSYGDGRLFVSRGGSLFMVSTGGVVRKERFEWDLGNYRLRYYSEGLSVLEENETNSVFILRANQARVNLSDVYKSQHGALAFFGVIDSDCMKNVINYLR